MTKMGQKLIEIAQKSRFCTFSVFVLLKFLRVVDWGTVCRTDGQKTLYRTENRAHDSSESCKASDPQNN